MPGLTGNAWFDNTALPRSRAALIAADAHCRVAGLERVYWPATPARLPRPGLDAETGAHGRPTGAATAAEPGGGTGGRLADRKFKVELMCIVDGLDAGMLVRHTEGSAWSAAAHARLMHTAKDAFESLCLKRYR